MKIAIINGSPRKSGATGLILKEIEKIIHKSNPDYHIRFYNLSGMNINNCLGCEKCYQLGHCVLNDEVDNIANEIKKCDGIIIGSPNYGSNVSAILKTFMDRGHFIVEQSLYNKTCLSLITYEIADGISALKILNKFFIVAGGKLRNKLLIKSKFNKDPLKNIKLKKKISKDINEFLKNLSKNKRKPFLQYIFNDLIVVNVIWAGYFKKFPEQFKGIIKIYRENKIHQRVINTKIFNNNI